MCVCTWYHIYSHIYTCRRHIANHRRASWCRTWSKAWVAHNTGPNTENASDSATAVENTLNLSRNLEQDRVDWTEDILAESRQCHLSCHKLRRVSQLHLPASCWVLSPIIVSLRDLVAIVTAAALPVLVAAGVAIVLKSLRTSRMWSIASRYWVGITKLESIAFCDIVCKEFSKDSA